MARAPVVEMSEADQEFCRTVGYFWTEKGDPTRMSAWDAERCKRLMPQFFEAWSMCELYRAIADTCAEASR